MGLLGFGFVLPPALCFEHHGDCSQHRRHALGCRGIGRRNPFRSDEYSCRSRPQPFHQSHDEQNIKGNRPIVKTMTASRANSRVVAKPDMWFLHGFHFCDLCVNHDVGTLRQWACCKNRRMRTAPMPRRPHHQAAAAYTNATAHPQRVRHRTTRCTSGSVRSPGSCKPHRRVRRPDTNAPGPRSRFPFLPWARHTSCRHSTHLALVWEKLKALLRLCVYQAMV
jgi:hypothetical protein